MYYLWKTSTIKEKFNFIGRNRNKKEEGAFQRSMYLDDHQIPKICSSKFDSTYKQVCIINRIKCYEKHVMMFACTYTSPRFKDSSLTKFQWVEVLFVKKHKGHKGVAQPQVTMLSTEYRPFLLTQCILQQPTDFKEQNDCCGFGLN